MMLVSDRGSIWWISGGSETFVQVGFSLVMCVCRWAPQEAGPAARTDGEGWEGTVPEVPWSLHRRLLSWLLQHCRLQRRLELSPPAHFIQDGPLICHELTDGFKYRNVNTVLEEQTENVRGCRGCLDSCWAKWSPWKLLDLNKTCGWSKKCTI